MGAGPKLNLQRLLTRHAQTAAEQEILSPGSPAALSFVEGLPDPNSFPINDLLGIAQRVLQREGRTALQYGDAFGHAGLREALVQKAKKEWNLRLTAENVILTHGSLAALGLIGFALLEPGDLVLVEAPTSPEVLETLRRFGAEFLGIPMDEHGLRMKPLGQHLARLKLEGRPPKLLCTAPTFQDPTGSLMPLERRQQLLELAQEFGLLVVEDDSHGDLRYEGDKVPPLLALDKAGVVLKIETCSTTLAPGFRLGWVTGPPEILASLAARRTDGGPPSFAASLLAEFIRLGMFDRHVTNLEKIYRNKRDTLLAALAEFGPPDLRWTKPSGGFFVWLTLPPKIDPQRLFREAQAEDVAYLPGRLCFPSDGDDSYLRLAFSHLSTGEIREGVERLIRAMERAR